MVAFIFLVLCIAGLLVSKTQADEVTETATSTAVPAPSAYTAPKAVPAAKKQKRVLVDQFGHPIHDPQDDYQVGLNTIYRSDLTGDGSQVQIDLELKDDDYKGVRNLTIHRKGELVFELFHYDKPAQKDDYTGDFESLSFVQLRKDGKTQIVLGIHESSDGGYILLIEWNGKEFVRTLQCSDQHEFRDLNGDGDKEVITRERYDNGIPKIYAYDYSQQKYVLVPQDENLTMTPGLVDWVSGTFTWKTPDGQEVKVPEILKTIKSYLPDWVVPQTINCYYGDLSQDGNPVILLIIGIKDSNLKEVMVLDPKGQLLDKACVGYFPEQLQFGTIKKNFPICFGVHFCAGSAMICEWQFYIFKDKKLKLVLSTSVGRYKNEMDLPLAFKDLDHNGINRIVTDDGSFKWNDSENCFFNVNKDGVFGKPATFHVNEDLPEFNADKERVQQLIHPDESKVEALIQKGKEQYRQHDYKKAIKFYDHAYVLSVTNEDMGKTLGYMGYAYYRDGQIKHAVGVLEHAVQLDPKNIMSYYNLTLAYWADGQQQKAVSQIAKVYEMDPKYQKLIPEDPQFKPILKSDVYQNWQTQSSNQK